MCRGVFVLFIDFLGKIVYDLFVELWLKLRLMIDHWKAGYYE